MACSRYRSCLGFGHPSRSGLCKSIVADRQVHRSSELEQLWKPQPWIRGRSVQRILIHLCIGCWGLPLHHHPQPRWTRLNLHQHPFSDQQQDRSINNEQQQQNPNPRNNHNHAFSCLIYIISIYFYYVLYICVE